MSSEIKSGNSRTYWIISDGSRYVDGVTDPDLVTTVGTGWHIYWIGTVYEEYLNECNNINILPRNNRSNVASSSDTVERISARQIRLWLIENGFSISQVENAIRNIADEKLKEKTLVEWEYAPYVEKSHPLILQIASILSMSPEEVNEAFVEAAKL